MTLIRDFLRDPNRSPEFKKVVYYSIIATLVVWYGGGFIKDQCLTWKYHSEMRRQLEKQREMQRKAAEERSKAQALNPQSNPRPSPGSLSFHPEPVPMEVSAAEIHEFFDSFLYGPYDSFTKGYCLFLMQLEQMKETAGEVLKSRLRPGQPPPRNWPGPLALANLCEDVDRRYQKTVSQMEEMELLSRETQRMKLQMAELIAIQGKAINALKNVYGNPESLNTALEIAKRSNKILLEMHDMMLEYAEKHPDEFSEEWIQMVQQRRDAWAEQVEKDEEKK